MLERSHQVRETQPIRADVGCAAVLVGVLPPALEDVRVSGRENVLQDLAASVLLRGMLHSQSVLAAPSFRREADSLLGVNLPAIV